MGFGVFICPNFRSKEGLRDSILSYSLTGTETRKYRLYVFHLQKGASYLLRGQTVFRGIVSYRNRFLLTAIKTWCYSCDSSPSKTLDDVVEI